MSRARGSTALEFKAQEAGALDSNAQESEALESRAQESWTLEFRTQESNEALESTTPNSRRRDLEPKSLRRPNLAPRRVGPWSPRRRNPYLLAKLAATSHGRPCSDRPTQRKRNLIFRLNWGPPGVPGPIGLPSAGGSLSSGLRGHQPKGLLLRSADPAQAEPYLRA